MRSLSITTSLVFTGTMVGLLQFGSLSSYAQNSNLEQCLETLHKTRQAINQSRAPNQQALFPALDPTYQQHKQNYENWAECVKGRKAPLTFVQTLDGKSYDVATFSGKILVINFWSTTCLPCIAEMPALNKLVKEYQENNVLFLGFAGDKATRLTSAFFTKHPFDFEIIPESQNMMSLFHTNTLPTTYIIDQHGIIRKAWMGLDSNNEMDKLAPYYKAKSVIDDLLITSGK